LPALHIHNQFADATAAAAEASLIFRFQTYNFQIPNVLSTSKPGAFLRPATHPKNQNNSLEQPNTQNDFSSTSSSPTHRVENFLINNNQTTKDFFFSNTIITYLQTQEFFNL
jgi:hypothetical protein